MWFIGVEVEQETSAPPPKKNPGSAPEDEKGILMSLWLRRRDLRTHLYIATVIKFLATYVYIFLIFFLIFLIDFIIVTINLFMVQLLAAFLIRINYLSIYIYLLVDSKRLD